MFPRTVLGLLALALALFGCQGLGSRAAEPSPTAPVATAAAPALPRPTRVAEMPLQALPRLQGAVDDPAALQAALQALTAFTREVWVAQAPSDAPQVVPWPAGTDLVLALTVGAGGASAAAEAATWQFYLESRQSAAAWNAALESALTEAGWFAQAAAQTLWCHPTGQWGLEADVRALAEGAMAAQVTLTPQPRWCAPDPPGEPRPQWLPSLSAVAGGRALSLASITGPQGEVYGGFAITPRSLDNLAAASAPAMQERGWQTQGCETWSLLDRTGARHEGVYLCRWQRANDQGPPQAVQVWVRLSPYGSRAVYALQAALFPSQPRDPDPWPRLVVPPQPVEPLRRALALVSLFMREPATAPGTVWVGGPPRPWPARLPRLEPAAWVVVQQAPDVLVVHARWDAPPEQALAQVRGWLEQAGWRAVPDSTRGFVVTSSATTWLACHAQEPGWWRVYARPAPQGEGAWVNLTWSADAPRGCDTPAPPLSPALEALPRLELPPGARLYWESQVALEPAAAGYIQAAVWTSTLPWPQEQAALTEALRAQGWVSGPAWDDDGGYAGWWRPPTGTDGPAVHLLWLDLGAGWRFGLMGAEP